MRPRALKWSKFLGVFILSLLITGQAAHAQISVRAECSQASAGAIFLPLIVKSLPFDPGRPLLLAPNDGTSLDNLIPLFTWELSTQPPDTSTCIALGFNPNPEYCMWNFPPNSSDWEFRFWYNFIPSTTYYWRVGAIYASDPTHPNWSDDFYFVTAPAGGVILAPPVQTGPVEGSIVPPVDVILSWEPVEGAVEYFGVIKNVTADSTFPFTITDTQFNVNEVEYIISPGYQYQWQVKARNDYAWSDFTPMTNFSTSSSAGFEASQ